MFNLLMLTFKIPTSFNFDSVIKFDVFNAYVYNGLDLVIKNTYLISSYVFLLIFIYSPI